MKNNKLECRSPDEAEAVFYEAFLHCDVEVMQHLWAGDDVTLVHPGSGMIVGHENVLRSWAHIFSHAKRPDIRFTVIKRMQSGDLAVHQVAEEVSTGSEKAVILASNVYQRIEGSWLMVAHHASLVNTEHGGHTLQ